MSGSLFSGSIIPQQPTGADTSTQYPLWLQQYTYGLANSAENLASQPYTPFPGAQVATPSDATQQAWTMAQGDVGDWQPYSQQAATEIGQAAPNLTGALSMIGGANPNLTQAQSLIQQGASPVTGQEINSYMSPYLGDVVGALQNASNTNFTQNQLPSISSQFVSSGQAASPQEMQADNNALYQTNQALDQSVSGALNSGYNTALSAAQQQQGVDINAGNALGSQQLQAGALQGQLGSELGSLQMQQGQYGLQQGAAEGALGQLVQQEGGYDVGQAAAAGQSQDTVNQANINAAMNNFYSQEQWPYQNLSYASNIIRGQDVPSNTMQVGLTPASQSSYTASPLSSFVGTTLGATALSNGATGNTNSGSGTNSLFALAKGGHVRKRANDNWRGALQRAA